MFLFIFSVMLALSVSFLCSLMEAATLSLTPAQLADLERHHPRAGSTWRQFKGNLDRPISVILLINTAAHTIGASVAGAQLDQLGGQDYILAFSLAFTYLMLQFTEILPKTLGVKYSRTVALLMAAPMAWAIRLCRPVIWFIRLVNRPFEGRRKAHTGASTLEELTALAGAARIANVIGAQQEQIIRGASALSEVTVEAVMLPLEHVTFLSTSQDLSQAILTAHMDPHTRFPICEGDDRNQVLGYVNFKEMIYYARTNPNNWSLRGIIRPVRFIGPTERAERLLRAFVQEHVHIAIVRSAEGKTLGMVTLEDIVEELVGDLEDEFDRLPRMFHELSGGTWMVGGGLTVADLASRLQAPLPQHKGTVSSWLIEKLGRVPKAGEVFRLGELDVMVRRTRRGKIFEIAVTTRKPPGAVAL